jgi:hypothetical protein
MTVRAAWPFIALGLDKGAVCKTVGFATRGCREALRGVTPEVDLVPNPAVFEIKAAPAAPLARRQRPGSGVERLARRMPGHTRAGTQTTRLTPDAATVP